MNKLIGLFEIFLLVLSAVSFSYIVAQTNELIEQLPIESGESKFIVFLREKALNYLSHSLVSAQSIQTCLLDNSGATCQEYPSETCDSQCTSSCFPGRRTDFSSCQLGTCFDTDLGLCSPGTPRATCEAQNGTWSLETPAQCNRRCCLIGPDGSGGASQAKLATQQECNYLGQTSGAPVQWDSQTTGEIQCLAKAKTQKEGACVLELLPELNKYNCQFTTEIKCLTNGGEFYVNQLCTNPQLNTKCEMTSNTKCFDGKDGVYFTDSCGNPANIYDSTKRNVAAYWSTVATLGQSCSLSSGSNAVANQQRCGNCDYLAGSTCGTPSTLDKQPISGQYVCKDLSCVDIDGNKRKHGESWCAFDSWTGLDGQNGTNEERAVDVPGSRHYKKLCYEGEIRLEPCAEFRNGLCVEQNVRDDFTTAQCRTNTGVLCTSYNENEEKLAKCEESPDCYLKHVGVDRFKFDVCVPKYPPGLDLSDDAKSDDSAAICSVASQTCTYYEKKGVDGRWSCKINCECNSPKLVETMNNLCISLGDCGTNVNLAGQLGKGHSVSGDRIPKISEIYLNELKKYITPKAGQRVDGLTNEQIENALGFDPLQFTPDELAEQIATYGLGATGLLAFQSGVAAAPSKLAILQGWPSAANGALIGAGIGYIVGLMFDAEGDELLYYVIGGAVVGGVAGYLGLLSYSTILGPVGWVLAIVVLIVIVIFTVAGVGKYRERKVEFKCLPWQPPAGGDNCSKCGELGVECTAYKCASLGKTCELLNPNTVDEACVNIAPNDASAPQIGFNKTYLSSNFSYEELGNGVKIKSASGDGCLQEYSPVAFDILTNEPAQCKLSATRPTNYDEMEDSFFDSSTNRYVTNHVESTAMATLDTLGISGADPNRRGEYNLYVLCEDKSGNAVDNAYNLRFCVSPANDIQPPTINKFVPESPGVVGLNSTTFDMQFYTNEPATCRYSTTDQLYETMEGEANCQNDLAQSTINGWPCIARLNVTSNENNYYFRCADQPWLGVDIQENSITLEEGRNVNEQSMPENGYVVKKTTTPLTISSVTPNDKTILSATSPVIVNVEVVTSGGIDSGKAFCKYSFNGGQYTDFFVSSLSNHKQTFTSLFAGDYDIKLRCNDRAGNIAEGNARFKIEIDNSGPLITRVYNSGSSLTVITNEASICEYSKSSCTFEFETGTALSGTNKVHTMSYANGVTYSIKCRDTFGNVGSCMSVSGGY